MTRAEFLVAGPSASVAFMRGDPRACARLDVYRVDPRLTAESELTAADVERLGDHENIRSRSRIAAAVRAVRASKPAGETGSQPRELRFALVFRDGAGRRVESVYADRFVAHGVIDGRPVRFRTGALAGWLFGGHRAS